MSYMGLYIYDFTHSASLASRIDHDYTYGAERCASLLASETRTLEDDYELVTLLIILAMQDVSIRHPSGRKDS